MSRREENTATRGRMSDFKVGLDIRFCRNFTFGLHELIGFLHGTELVNAQISLKNITRYSSGSSIKHTHIVSLDIYALRYLCLLYSTFKYPLQFVLKLQMTNSL